MRTGGTSPIAAAVAALSLLMAGCSDGPSTDDIDRNSNTSTRTEFLRLIAAGDDDAACDMAVASMVNDSWIIANNEGLTDYCLDVSAQIRDAWEGAGVLDTARDLSEDDYPVEGLGPGGRPLALGTVECGGSQYVDLTGDIREVGEGSPVTDWADLISEDEPPDCK